MEPFNIETFVEEPTLRVVKSLKKAELVSVAQHYKLEVGSTMKKSQIKQLVIDYLVEEEIVSEEEVKPPMESGTDQNSLELRRLELQDKERERESQLKLKELEIREKELSIQLRMKELEAPPATTP